MIQALYIDLFCGAGGTSTGVDSAKINAKECAKVIACVNHDANAIASHAANHPDALHFTEDIRTLDLTELRLHLNEQKILHPEAVVVLWASLECTNFSKAKGGQPRDADSRTLAEHLFRYISDLNPDYIQIENVEEFMSWGDMDENGKPLSRDKGKSYNRWVQNIKNHGYKFDHKILNSADFGAYTSRKRFFGIFARHGLPIIFPTPTHSKNHGKDLFNTLAPWKPVKDVLDFEDEGTTIFREKPLSEKTLQRIYAGLIKFVAGGKDKWLLKYNSINGKTGRHIHSSIDEPCSGCHGRFGSVSTHFLSRYNGGDPEHKSLSVENPCGTLTTGNRFAAVGIHFLSKYYSGDPNSMVTSIEEPAHTIRTKDGHAFISAYYGNGDNVSEITNPSPTVTCKDRLALIQSQFIDMQYGNGQPVSIYNPAGTVTTSPKHNLVTVKPLTVNCETGEIALIVYTSDTPMTVKIKEFMAIYGIIDIKMRMLRIPELKQIMGFPKDYVLIGSQADQKKFIGNAVEVTMARKLCEALCNELIKLKETIAA